MARQVLLAFVLGFSILVAPRAFADCVDTPRKVALGDDNSIILKSYDCRLDQGHDGARVRAEFHRFSDTVASLIVTRSSSDVLKKVIGSPKVAENEIFNLYADLLKRFGVSTEVPADPTIGPSVQLSGANTARVSDKINARRIRTLPGQDSSSDFPAATEIAALRKQIIPDGLNYYFSFGASQCSKMSGSPSRGRIPVCAKFQNEDVEMTFWRGLRADDIADYAKSINAYNALLQQSAADLRRARDSRVTASPWAVEDVPSGLKLAAHVAGSTLPEDFILLIGTYVAGSCGDDSGSDSVQGIGGWEFRYLLRDIILDALLIENTSPHPVQLDGLLGERGSNTGLRPIGASGPRVSNTSSAVALSETLAPGQKLLIPLRIVFPHPIQHSWSHIVIIPTGLPISNDLRKFENKAAEVHRYLGANQFTGNVESFRAPRPRSYLYGPDINVTGLVVSGRRLDFVRRAANFLELTVAQEIGSCPYLQSWNGRDQEWINHGKILHRAQGRAREYAETIVFSDFRPSFRLEEREAEVAFIDHAELSLTLTNGTTVSLPPDEPRLAHRDLDYLELMWGDRVTFGFALPDGISSADVESSRLTLSGYYERYADLLAGSSDPGSSDSPARGGYFRSDIGNGSLKALVCPVTVARPEPADQLLSRLLPKGGSDVSKAGHPVARRGP